MMRPLIYCDIDENASGIPERLAESDCLVRSTRLDPGDYLVSAALAIERKSATDFVDSIFSGRLEHQIHRLAETYERAALLIEGDSWEGNRRFKAPLLAKLYRHTTLRSNVSCFYSPSKSYTPRLLKALAIEEQRDQPQSQPVPRPPVRIARSGRDVLRSLPGVESARADALMARFGSLRGVLLASREELQSAVGPKVGAEIYNVLASS